MKRAPGPRSIATLRNVLAVRRNYTDAFLALHRAYGDVVRMRIPHLVHLFFHPDDVKYVLKDNARNFRKSDFLDELHPLLGEGLLTSEGELWKRQRRLMAPAFQRENLGTFVPTIAQATERLLDRWDATAKRGGVRDVARDMMELTFSIAGLTLFGSDLGAEAALAGRALAEASEGAVKRMIAVVKLPLVLPVGVNRLVRRGVADLERIVSRVLDERRRAPATGRADLLGRLMDARDPESGNPMSEKLLRDEVMTLLLAGHETTSNALAWALYLLTQSPEPMARLRSEAESVLGAGEPSFADVTKLAYARQVLLEAMRLFPPAPVISRNALIDQTIHGYAVPKESIVECSPWVTHRHEAFWPDPERFDPDRFLPERAAKQHPFAYFPFGGGPRECIGKNFALIEGTLILALVARRFDLRLEPGQRMETLPLITLKPRYGVRMRFAARAPRPRPTA